MLTLAGTLLIVSLGAQTHPRLIFGSTEVSNLQAQVVANTTRWQALKADCDAALDLPVAYPDRYGDGGPQSPRVPNSGTNFTSISIIASYAGEYYLDHVWELGACYLATKGTSGFNQTTANAYGDKLKHIGIAASVNPGVMRKAVGTFTVRVTNGRATAVSAGLSGLLTGMEIYIENSGNADLNGYHDMTLEVSGTGATIAFPIKSTVPDGSYSCDISVAIRLHPLVQRISISGVTQAASAVITALNHGMQTGDTVLIEGLTGNYAALNGTHTATVITTSTFSVPVSSVGFGTFNQTYGFGTAGELNKLAQFYIAGNVGTYLANGNTVTVADLTGCTNVNGTRTLVVESSSQVSFTVSGTPLVATSPCTNYSYSSLRDSGYSFRNYAVMLAMIYDWAYDRLSAGERQAMVDRVNLYMRESKRSEQDSTTLHPAHNYFAGFINGAVLASIAFDPADNTEPTLDAFVNDRLYGQGYLLEYFHRWLSNGGFPQGNREYGNNAATSIYVAALASMNASKSWTTDSNWGWLGGQLSYMMSFASPSLTEGDYNQFTAGINSNDSGINAPPLAEPNRLNPSMTAILSYWARKAGHPLAAAFTRFHYETKALVAAASATIKPFTNAQTNISTRPRTPYEFLFEEPGAAEEEWRTDARRNGRGFHGGNYVSTRLDWTDTTVQVTFDASRELDSVSQGKSRWNAGSVTVRRGRNALIDYPNALISRYGTSSQHSSFHNTVNITTGTATWRWDNNFFADNAAAAATATGAQDYRSQCFATTVAATGAHSRKQIQPLDSRIDKITDHSAVTYWRGINLECNYGRPSAVNSRSNVEGWTREVITLRDSGVVLVRDATRTVATTDRRFLSWVVPSTPALESGTRYRINNPSGGFLGIITVVRPTSPVITSSTWSGATFLNALEIAPSGSGKDVTYLTVLDPAENDTVTKTVSELSGTGGGTYVQIGTDSVVTFADGATSFTYPGTSAIHRHIMSGLTASTTHYLTNTGGTTWTINTSSGTTSFTSDANGIGVVIIP